MTFGKAPHHACTVTTDKKCYQLAAVKATVGRDNATSRIQIWEE